MEEQTKSQLGESYRLGGTLPPCIFIAQVIANYIAKHAKT